MVRPSGTVTFLFTDIEGSTRRWESDPDAMRSALTSHDEVLRSAIEAHEGWLFKHTGDGVCAAFGSARAALDAAVAAQRRLRLPVRMGVASGEVERRGEDYFGPTLNRAARVMAAGHGGQILVAASTASLLSGVELIDLGERRLRDLSGAEHIYQVRAEGLAVEFAPLRTVDVAPGNLPVQVTSFVGREVEVKELTELVRVHRLVTLTGVGGVGKTRLAVQIAAELVTEFADGVWLVELAPVGDPSAVPDVVATVLGVSAQAALTMTDSVAQALSGRRLLVVLDNCEHVLDAAAELVETILGRAANVSVLATSREGLRVQAEHLWPVPSLEVRGGVESAAVELFVERARAVAPGFEVVAPAQAVAVTEICRRLDGIALAIELAAARMVSMNPVEVSQRLTDRFRLLAGSRRGLERHQTLRQAVAWSFDLLDDTEQLVLHRCSVFADGFDLAAAAHLCAEGEMDEYRVLDLLDSLVRKSLVTTEQVAGHTRYGFLETIRQFAEEQLAATGTSNYVRDCHASYFADQAIAHWDVWDGQDLRVALDWVEVEFANLRAAYRWAVDQADLVNATAIAAHTAMIGLGLQSFEPSGWAEEILESAAAAGVHQLPRLYTAASICTWTGRPEVALRYALTATELEADPRFDPFEPGWGNFFVGAAHGYAGRMDRWLETFADLVERPGFGHIAGLCGVLYALPAVGRANEAIAMAEDAVATIRAHGNPFWTAFALFGYGRAFTETDPTRALPAFWRALDFAREHRLPLWEAAIARDTAPLEALHGDLDRGLALFDTTIDSFHRAGDAANLAMALANVVVFFDRVERPEVAATLYGASKHQAGIVRVINLTSVVEHLHAGLGDTVFDRCVAAGDALEVFEAAHYARAEIERARDELRPHGKHRIVAHAIDPADEH